MIIINLEGDINDWRYAYLCMINVVAGNGGAVVLHQVEIIVSA